jgi:hypothetical protein
MCPLSRRFIVDQLYPIAVGDLADFVRIEMLPQGKQDNQVSCSRIWELQPKLSASLLE